MSARRIATAHFHHDLLTIYSHYMMPYILPRRRNASSAPSSIRHTVALVFVSSIEPAATILLLSLELFSAIICSASPNTAMLALCVTTIT